MRSPLFNTFAKHRRTLGDGLLGTERTRQNLAVLDYYQSGRGDAEFDVGRELTERRARWLKDLAFTILPALGAAVILPFLQPDDARTMTRGLCSSALLITLGGAIHVWCCGLLPTRSRVRNQLRIEAAIHQVLRLAMAADRGAIHHGKLTNETRA